MNLNSQKLFIDLLMFFDFLIVAVSGFVLWLVLPRGSGRVAETFLFERNELLFIHNWTSVILIVLLVIHFFLNWNWISAMIFRRKN